MMKQQFIEHLRQEHAQISRETFDGLIAENLISPFEVRLPSALLQQAQNFVSACYRLRESEEYQHFLAPEKHKRGLKDPGNKSILMSYDFHVDENGNLKLIEINTNASFLALGYEMYRSRKLPLPVADFKIEEIKKNILTELSLMGRSLVFPKVAIIDENPRQQKLYMEFLLYQSFFEKWGWKTTIKDFREPMNEMDFIYNRHTDFYLQNTEAASLWSQFLSKEICFSPNPFEYFCLADKQRMIDWSSDGFWKQVPSMVELRPVIKKNLPLTQDVNPLTAEEIWVLRKGLFLKPKRAFGAKQSYRGSSISRKAFEGLLVEDFIAQQYVPPQELNFAGTEGEITFKSDLRFYAYQDRVQMVVARLYQGQVTNLKTPQGGFAPVIFS